MLFVCWGHFYVFLVFRIFLSNPFFLIYKTHVALFSVHTVSTPFTTVGLRNTYLNPDLFPFRPGFIALYSLSQDCFQCQHHCITVSYLMTLKCHISSRKQNEHKESGIKNKSKKQKNKRNETIV